MVHKTRTKALSWLLSLAMALSLLPGMSLTAWAAEGDVAYLDASGTSQTCTEYTEVSNSTTTWNEGWYVVNGSIYTTGSVSVNGAVNLILTDGAQLGIYNKHITIADGGSLTVYGQTSGSGSMEVSHGMEASSVNSFSGKLTVNGGSLPSTPLMMPEPTAHCIASVAHTLTPEASP